MNCKIWKQRRPQRNKQRPVHEFNPKPTPTTHVLEGEDVEDRVEERDEDREREEEGVPLQEDALDLVRLVAARHPPLRLEREALGHLDEERDLPGGRALERDVDVHALQCGVDGEHVVAEDPEGVVPRVRPVGGVVGELFEWWGGGFRERGREKSGAVR